MHERDVVGKVVTVREQREREHRKQADGEVRLGKARLDLAEDDRLPVARDDVCLAEGGLVVGLQDAVAEALQVRGGEPLPLPAESFFVNVLR